MNSLVPQPITLTGRVVSLEPLAFEHAGPLLEAAQSDEIWLHTLDRPQTAEAMAAIQRSLRPTLKGLIREWLRAESQHLPVRILNMHLQCPGIVARRAVGFRPTDPVFLVQSCHVVDTDPRPGAGTSLSAAAEIDTCPIPTD